jgi:hypothetical protein
VNKLKVLQLSGYREPYLASFTELGVKGWLAMANEPVCNILLIYVFLKFEMYFHERS